MTINRFRRIALRLLGCCAALALCGSAAQAQTRVWPTRLTNVAAAGNGGRIISSTSTLDDDPQYGADNLIDGQIYNPLTKSGSFGWASNKYDPIAMDSVTIGFADNRIVKLGKLVFNPTVAVAAERWAKDIEVQVSTDTVQGPYRTAALITLRKAAEPQEFTILPTEARFVRLIFRSNWGSDRAVALGEVEMYEAVDTDDPLGGLIARLESAVKELKIYQQLQVQLDNTGARRSHAPEAPSTPAENTPAALSQPALSQPALSQPALSQPALSQPALSQPALSPETRAVLQLVDMSLPSTGGALATSNKNIAAAANGGHIVDSSGTFNGNEKQYGPQNLIDGENFLPGENKGSFGWASEGFKPEKEFVTIGFAGNEPHSISKVILNPVSNQSQLRWARTIIMQVTNGTPKEGPWRTVETFNLNQEPVDQEFTFRPVEARYVRFVFAANGPANLALPNADPRVISDRSVSLGEIEIYEPVAREDNLAQLISKLNQIVLDLTQLYDTHRLVPREQTPQPANNTAQPQASPQRTTA